MLHLRTCCAIACCLAPVPAVMCAPHNSPSVLASRMPGYLCVCVSTDAGVCVVVSCSSSRELPLLSVFLTLCIAVGGGRRPTCLALGVPAR
jgi:hypothetical protein